MCEGPCKLRAPLGASGYMLQQEPLDKAVSQVSNSGTPVTPVHLLVVCFLQLHVLPLQLHHVNLLCMQLLQPAHQLPVSSPLRCMFSQHHCELLQDLLLCGRLQEDVCTGQQVGLAAV